MSPPPVRELPTLIQNEQSNPLTPQTTRITFERRRVNREPWTTNPNQQPHFSVIKAVLFDIDGTLIGTGGAGVRAFERTSATVFGIPNGTSHLRFAGRTDTGLIKEFFRHHKIQDTRENTGRFLEAYVHFLDHHLATTSGCMCPGVTHWLNELERMPNPPLVGLLTGNIRLGAEIKLRHFGLWGSFRVGAFGCDHADRNELAEIAMRRCFNLLGAPLRGDELLVIGDTPLDIECARAIGARCLAVATGNYTLEELRQHQPTWAVETLESISPVITQGGCHMDPQP